MLCSRRPAARRPAAENRPAKPCRGGRESSSASSEREHLFIFVTSWRISLMFTMIFAVFQSFSHPFSDSLLFARPRRLPILCVVKNNAGPRKQLCVTRLLALAAVLDIFACFENRREGARAGEPSSLLPHALERSERMTAAAAVSPWRNGRQIEIPAFRLVFLFGGDGETRTPAPVSRPTPLAGRLVTNLSTSPCR